MSFFQGIFGPPDVAQLRASGDVSGLIKALAYKKDEYVRVAAAEALGAARATQAVEPLVAALKDERWRVRIAATNALGAIADPQAVEPLVWTLHHDEYANKAAAEALGAIGDERALEPLIAALNNPYLNETIARALANIGPAAIEPLSELLNHQRGPIRETAARGLAALAETDGLAVVEPMVAALSDKRRSIQTIAANTLMAIGEPAVDLLLETLHDENKDRRAGAAAVLRKIGGAHILDPLLVALYDTDPRVREACVWSLGAIGDPRVFEPLILALVDPREEVRYAASISLEKIGKPAISPLIETLVHHPQRTMRHAVAAVLERTEWQPDASEAGAAYWITRRNWELCLEAGAAAVAPLVLALQDEEESVRVTVTELLGQLQSPRAVEPLIKVLADEYLDVCIAAAASLGQIGDQRAVAPLINTLSDPYESVCMAAAEALGDIGDPRAVQPLISILGDRDIHWVASRALCKIGMPAVEPLIKTLGHHQDVVLRQAAARTLGQLGSGEAVEPLIAALNDSPMVRWAAAESLGLIGHPQAARPLVNILKYQDVHWIATRALRRIGPPTIEPLAAALSDELPPVRRSAARVLGQIGDRWSVSKIIPLVQDSDRRVKMAALEALGKIGDLRSAEHIAAALLDPSWDVRLAAARALDNLTVKPDQSEVGAFYWAAKREWDECVKIGEPALAPLIAIMHDPEDHVARAGAALSLGKIGDPRALESLTNALDDPHEEVRQVAATALGKIGDPRGVQILSLALKDRYLIVRKAAAHALIHIGAPAIEPLATVLEEPDDELRQAIVNALGKIGAPGIGLILPYLEHKEAYVRKAAAQALGKVGSTQALKPLVNLLTDGDDEVRQTAALALAQIGDETAIDSLVAALKYADGDMRIAAAHALEALGWVPDRSAAGAAYWMIKGDWDRCVKMGEAAIEPLISALRDRDRRSRQTAAETLGKLYKSRRLDPVYKERVREALENIAHPFVDDTLELMYEE